MFVVCCFVDRDNILSWIRRLSSDLFSLFRSTSRHVVKTVKPTRTLCIGIGTMVLCLGEGDIVSDGSLVSVLTITDDSVDSWFRLIWFVHVCILPRFSILSRDYFRKIHLILRRLLLS